MTVFKITGKVVSSNTKEGIKGFRVEAWDKDLFVHDMVGSAITGEDGVFRIQFDESYFKELFLDSRPDLFFKVFKGARLIKSTEDSVHWNVEREDIEQTIEVEEVSDMTTSKSKAVIVRQRGSEIFKFVTLRPFQRQDEAIVEKRKVLCYKPVDEEKSEFHHALLDAKEHPPEGSGPREAMVAKAREFIETSGSTFVQNIDNLSNPQAPRSSQYTGYKSSLGLLEEWIFRARKPISHEDMLLVIKNAFNKDNIGDVAQLHAFKTDIYRLQDSIMALAIVPSHAYSQRDHLVNALRICKVIERMGVGDAGLMQSYGIDKAMKAPVVLPTDIFPLPPAKERKIEVISEQFIEREKKLKKLRNKRNALKEAIEELGHLRPEDYVPPLAVEDSIVLKLKKADIDKLSDSTRTILKVLRIDLTIVTITEVMRKLEAERDKAEKAKAREVQAAIEELISLASSRLPKPTEQPAEKEMPAVAEKWKPWTLKQEAIDRLHNTTGQVIKELGLDLTRDPMPYVVNAFEKELSKVGAKLFRPPRSKRIIQRGMSRMEFLPGLEISPWPWEDLEPTRVPLAKGLVQPIGIGEYNTVRQTLLSYEPGEIAHIENVLRGEYKERVHRRLRRMEEEVTYEEERQTITEKELQGTDRFELKREASETIKEEHKANAGVTVKYEIPKKFSSEVKAGYIYTHAKEQSKKTSVSYARDVTEKSLSRLEEKVREVRTEKSIEEFEETNTHGIDNKDKSDHAVGIYRWVDKLYEAQVIGYGERLFFDFVIPEPAAFYLYALTHGASTDLEEPVPPMVDENGEPCGEDDPNARSLRPDDIQPDNYMSWVTLYSVSGIEPPSAPFIYVAETFRKEGSWTNDKPELLRVVDSKKIALPSGYNVVSVYAVGDSDHFAGYVATIIDDWYKFHIEGHNFVHWVPNFSSEGDTYDSEKERGIPVSIQIQATAGFVMNVLVECKRSKEEVKRWQIETYDAIMQAYLNKKAEFEEKLALAAIQEGISISGRNPEQNREIEETELKRWALSMVTGQYFEDFNAMQTDRQGYPGISFVKAKAEGSYIQFFEQAFEWPLMTYLFYPYFWGKREASWEGGPTWVDKITSIQDVDPLFEKFLKAGAARITVPVRPGFEEAINNYVSTGEIWDGGEKPTLDDPLYVSIVEEIQQQQGAYVEKSEGTISVEHDSMQVVGVETNFEESDVDREIYIESKHYVIAEVQGAEHLTLTEPYRGDTKEHARYYIGARLVGGPWEVRVPTSLVYLQEDATLPDFTEEG